MAFSWLLLGMASLRNFIQCLIYLRNYLRNLTFVKLYNQKWTIFLEMQIAEFIAG